MAPNPYAPPQAPREAPLPTADAADLFVEMQPTTQVRAAGVAAILAGVACLFVAVQFVIGAVAQRPIVLAIEAGVAALGVAFFALARGVVGARAWAGPGGIGLCVVTGVALLGVLVVSGALSTLLAGAAALATLVLLVAASRDLRRMAQARAAMVRAGEGLAS